MKLAIVGLLLLATVSIIVIPILIRSLVAGLYSISRMIARY